MKKCKFKHPINHACFPAIILDGTEFDIGKLDKILLMNPVTFAKLSKSISATD